MLKRILCTAFACALLVGAWKLGQHALWERQMGSASLSWPSTEGAVVESGLRTTGMGTRTTTSAAILYEYRVDGQDYRHDRIQFGAHGTGGGAGPLGHYGQKAPGEPVTVFFDPAQPTLATLETGPTQRSLGLLAAAGALAAFAAILLRVGSSPAGEAKE